MHLNDLILEMEVRATARAASAPDVDVWTQLQQKEADIQLAAELGKALLEENHDLVKQQERLVEEYSQRIEKLEQEKHILRQKLALAEEENDQRVLELQSDLNELKSKLLSKESIVRQMEREKSVIIDELSQQNARLTERIQEAQATEQRLDAQIQELKDQYNHRNTSLQEHVNSLESIKTELSLTTEKRHKLERRLQLLHDEKESLLVALEEASDRIHMLERHAREQETKLEGTLQALDRIQRENNVLSERLGSDANCQSKKSLQIELEGDDGLADSGYAESKSHHHHIWMEARSVYIQLKALVDSLKIGHDDDSGLNSDISMDLESMDTTHSSKSHDAHEAIEFRPGMLAAMSDELTRLLLNLDAGNFKKMLDQTRNIVLEQEDEIKRSHQIIQQLETKLTIKEVELQNVGEERDQARSDLAGSTQRDDLLLKAQTERNAANERRTKAEVELAKTRVELMQANSQLLESIQQKVELSQQLEQWQMDMQELINEQMRSKMVGNQMPARGDKQASTTAATIAKRVSRYKLWSLFQR